MQLSRNAKGSVTFLLATWVIIVFDVVQMNANHDWEDALPMWLGHAMHSVENLGMPVIILAGAYAMLLVWTGNVRVGALIITVISLVNIALNAPTTYWRVSAGFLQGAVICGVEALIGVATLYYSINALRERATESTPEPAPA